MGAALAAPFPFLEMSDGVRRAASPLTDGTFAFMALGMSPILAVFWSIDLGIPEAAAHMFIFYFSVLSEVSPPIGLSPFAAAALTGGNPYRTMMLSWKYALPAFLVPFMFTQPAGLAMLLRDTTVPEAIVATVSAAIGITAITTGVGGYLLRATTVVERALLIVAGLLLLLPTPVGDLVGLALFAVALLLQALARRAAVVQTASGG
ncbi:MAG: TRAP transporter large permease subunit [Chloroflexi bacterium]|nr:TRAP transporter large permease subunit [Chloroflexota bacterium]